MDIANLLVEKLVTGHGTLEPVLPLDNLFEGQNKLVLNYLKNHQEKHKKLPGRELFERSFPPESYPLNPAGIQATFDELIEDGRDKASHIQRGMLMSELVDAEDDADKFWQIIGDAQNKTKIVTDDLFPILLRSQLNDLPEAEPLIYTVLDKGHITFLNGKYGSYKSFLALDWACCVATGKSWKGHSTERGKALYVAAEGASGQRVRMNAWEEHHGRKVSDGSFHLIPKPLQLGNDLHITWLCSQIEKTGYDLVVIDTLARTTVGLDENSAKDMGVVINNLYKLRDAAREAGTAILVLHHLGKNGAAGARGSTALPAGIDDEYLLEKKDNGTAYLTCTKRKDGPDDLKMFLAIEPAAESCVLEETQPPEIDKDAGQRRIEVMELAEKSIDGITSPDVQALGIPQKSADRIIKDLLSEGKLVRAGKRGQASLYQASQASQS